MYVNIKIVVKGNEVIRPKGFYYKGTYPKLKIVVVGDDLENTYDKRTFDAKDCEIYLSKTNCHGDTFEI